MAEVIHLGRDIDGALYESAKPPVEMAATAMNTDDV